MNTTDFFGQLEKPSKTTAEIRAFEFQQEILPRLRASGWKGMDRFMTQSINTSCKPQMAVMKLAESKCVDVGAIVALVGIRGSGKTTIAAQIAIRRAELWMNWHRRDPKERAGAPPRGFCHYTKLTDLLARFKAIYADFGSISSDQLIGEREQLCKLSLLVIDELHDCDEQRRKDRLLTDIIDRRYAARKDTILISNQDADDFAKTTGPSVMSRLSEHGLTISCNWSSWRDKNN